MIRQDSKQQRQQDESKQNKASDERGFTLLETCTALVVMMVVAMGAASAFVYAISNNNGAYDRLMTMAVAQKRMEWLRTIPFDETTGAQTYSYPNGGLKATATPVVETITSGGRPYRITTTITDVNTDATSTTNTIKTITIFVRPEGKGWNQTTSVFGSVTLTTERAMIHIGSNL